MRRNKSQEIANSPKHTLAAISFSEYLNSLAASRNTSLVSCSASIIVPILKNLYHAQEQKAFLKNRKQRKAKMGMYAFMYVVFYRVLIYLPGQIGVGDQDGGDNVMRHHDREVLAASLPGNESADAVDVEATLAHVEEHDREAAQVSNLLGMFVVVVVVKEEKRMRKIWYDRSKIKKGRKRGCT